MATDSESSDMTDLGEATPKAGIPATRIDTGASFLKFALKNRGSEAAKTLRVQDHSLTDAQIDELDNRVNYTMKKNSGFSSTLSGIWDYVATALQCLVGQFTGDCGFKDFSAIKASRRAMRTARPLYEALHVPGPDGTSSFAGMAESVNGIKPDGKGGFMPSLDDKGQATGFYKASLDKSFDPKRSYISAVEDRGLQPSQAQIDRMGVIYQEEVTKLYQDAEVKALVKKYRPDPLKKGKDTEAHDFVSDDKMKKHFTTIADRIIADEAIKKGGAFKYDQPQVREKLIGRIKWSVSKEHKERLKDTPIPDVINPSITQLGAMPSPDLRIPMPEGTSRVGP